MERGPTGILWRKTKARARGSWLKNPCLPELGEPSPGFFYIFFFFLGPAHDFVLFLYYT